MTNLCRWLSGATRKKYAAQVAESHKRGERRRRLNIQEIEDYFQFTIEDYSAMWYPISFVIDLGFWNPTGPARRDYEELRVSTLVIMSRIIVVLLTGKVQNRALSNNVRIRILDSTSMDEECRPWPSMMSSAGRPQGTSGWEQESCSYPTYKDSVMNEAMWARIDPPARLADKEEEHASTERVRTEKGKEVEASESVIPMENQEKGGEKPGEKPVDKIVNVHEKIDDVRGEKKADGKGEKDRETIHEKEHAGFDGEDSGLENNRVAPLDGVMPDGDTVSMGGVDTVRERSSNDTGDVVYETDEEIIDAGDTPGIPFAMDSEFHMKCYEGLLSLELLGDLEKHTSAKKYLSYNAPPGVATRACPPCILHVANYSLLSHTSISLTNSIAPIFGL